MGMSTVRNVPKGAYFCHSVGHTEAKKLSVEPSDPVTNPQWGLYASFGILQNASVVRGCVLIMMGLYVLSDGSQCIC